MYNTLRRIVTATLQRRCRRRHADNDAPSPDGSTMVHLFFHKHKHDNRQKNRRDQQRNQYQNAPPPSYLPPTALPHPPKPWPPERPTTTMALVPPNRRTTCLPYNAPSYSFCSHRPHAPCTTAKNRTATTPTPHPWERAPTQPSPSGTTDAIYSCNRSPLRPAPTKA